VKLHYAFQTEAKLHLILGKIKWRDVSLPTSTYSLPLPALYLLTDLPTYLPTYLPLPSYLYLPTSNFLPLYLYLLFTSTRSSPACQDMCVCIVQAEYLHRSFLLLTALDAFALSVFPQMKWISVAKSTKLFRKATVKRDLNKHLSHLVAACDRNRTEFHDWKEALTELKLREDNSDAIEIFLHFLTATVLFA